MTARLRSGGFGQKKKGPEYKTTQRKYQYEVKGKYVEWKDDLKPIVEKLHCHHGGFIYNPADPVKPRGCGFKYVTLDEAYHRKQPARVMDIEGMLNIRQKRTNQVQRSLIRKARKAEAAKRRRVQQDDAFLEAQIEKWAMENEQMIMESKEASDDTIDESEGLLDSEQCAIVLGSYRGGRGGPFIKRGAGNRQAYENGQYCRQYQEGQCRFGEDCKFKHDLENDGYGPSHRRIVRASEEEEKQPAQINPNSPGRDLGKPDRGIVSLGQRAQPTISNAIVGGMIMDRGVVNKQHTYNLLGIEEAVGGPAKRTIITTEIIVQVSSYASYGQVEDIFPGESKMRQYKTFIRNTASCSFGNNIYDVYATTPKPIAQAIAPKIVLNSKLVIELGCGIGGDTTELAKLGQVIALDHHTQTLQCNAHNCKIEGVKAAGHINTDALGWIKSQINTIGLTTTVYLDAVIGGEDDWNKQAVSIMEIDYSYPLTDLIRELMQTQCRLVIKLSKNTIVPTVIAAIHKATDVNRKLDIEWIHVGSNNDTETKWWYDMLIVGENDFQYQAGMSVSSKPFVPNSTSSDNKPSVSRSGSKHQEPSAPGGLRLNQRPREEIASEQHNRITFEVDAKKGKYKALLEAILGMPGMVVECNTRKISQMITDLIDINGKQAAMVAVLTKTQNIRALGGGYLLLTELIDAVELLQIQLIISSQNEDLIITPQQCKYAIRADMIKNYMHWCELQTNLGSKQEYITETDVYRGIYEPRPHGLYMIDGQCYMPVQKPGKNTVAVYISEKGKGVTEHSVVKDPSSNNYHIAQPDRLARATFRLNEGVGPVEKDELTGKIFDEARLVETQVKGRMGKKQTRNPKDAAREQTLMQGKPDNFILYLGKVDQFKGNKQQPGMIQRGMCMYQTFKSNDEAKNQGIRYLEQGMYARIAEPGTAGRLRIKEPEGYRREGTGRGGNESQPHNEGEEQPRRRQEVHAEVIDQDQDDEDAVQYATWMMGIKKKNGGYMPGPDSKEFESFFIELMTQLHHETLRLAEKNGPIRQVLKNYTRGMVGTQNMVLIDRHLNALVDANKQGTDYQAYHVALKDRLYTHRQQVYPYWHQQLMWTEDLEQYDIRRPQADWNHREYFITDYELGLEVMGFMNEVVFVTTDSYLRTRLRNKLVGQDNNALVEQLHGKERPVELSYTTLWTEHNLDEIMIEGKEYPWEMGRAWPIRPNDGRQHSMIIPKMIIDTIVNFQVEDQTTYIIGPYSTGIEVAYIRQQGQRSMALGEDDDSLIEGERFVAIDTRAVERILQPAQAIFNLTIDTQDTKGHVRSDIMAVYSRPELDSMMRWIVNHRHILDKVHIRLPHNIILSNLAHQLGAILGFKATHVTIYHNGLREQEYMVTMERSGLAPQVYAGVYNPDAEVIKQSELQGLEQSNIRINCSKYLAQDNAKQLIKAIIEHNDKETMACLIKADWSAVFNAIIANNPYKKQIMLEREKTDQQRVHAHHLNYAEIRRKYLIQMFMDINDYPLIVYIGGHVKREFPFTERAKFVYVNPICSGEDQKNNQTIRENYNSSWVAVIEKRLQDTSREEICASVGLGEDTNITWVSIHSSYYLEWDLMEKVQPKDKMIIVGHRTHNDSMTEELPEILDVTGPELEMNGHYIKMGMIRTNDNYYHARSRMLEYEVKSGITEHYYNELSASNPYTQIASWACKPNKMPVADNYQNGRQGVVYKLQNNIYFYREAEAVRQAEHKGTEYTVFKVAQSEPLEQCRQQSELIVETIQALERRIEKNTEILRLYYIGKNSLMKEYFETKQLPSFVNDNIREKMVKYRQEYMQKAWEMEKSIRSLAQRDFQKYLIKTGRAGEDVKIGNEKDQKIGRFVGRSIQEVKIVRLYNTKDQDLKIAPSVYVQPLYTPQKEIVYPRQVQTIIASHRSGKTVLTAERLSHGQFQLTEKSIESVVKTYSTYTRIPLIYIQLGAVKNAYRRYSRVPYVKIGLQDHYKMQDIDLGRTDLNEDETGIAELAFKSDASNALQFQFAWSTQPRIDTNTARLMTGFYWGLQYARDLIETKEQVWYYQDLIAAGQVRVGYKDSWHDRWFGHAATNDTQEGIVAAWTSELNDIYGHPNNIAVRMISISSIQQLEQVNANNISGFANNQLSANRWLTAPSDVYKSKDIRGDEWLAGYADSSQQKIHIKIMKEIADQMGLDGDYTAAQWAITSIILLKNGQALLNYVPDSSWLVKATEDGIVDMIEIAEGADIMNKVLKQLDLVTKYLVTQIQYYTPFGHARHLFQNKIYTSDKLALVTTVPRIYEVKTDDYTVTVTNKLQEALKWVHAKFSIGGEKECGFDLEADPFQKRINCMQIACQDKTGLVFYGKEVKIGQYVIYHVFQMNDVTTYVWDANLDGIYEKYVDLQLDPIVTYPHSAKMSLAMATKKILGRDYKLTVEGDWLDKRDFYAYFTEETIPEYHVKYAIMDAIACLDLNMSFSKFRDKSQTLRPFKIGRATYYAPEEYKDYQWCIHNNQQTMPIGNVLTKANNEAVKEAGRRVVFCDMGSGSTGVSCLKQVIVSWLTREQNDKNMWRYEKRLTDDELDERLKIYMHVDLLNPGATGVALSKAIRFCLLNNIDIRIYTTDDPDMFIKVPRQRKIHKDTLILLSHHGHAWLGCDPASVHLGDEPQDCHCGRCVILKKTHKPGRCNVCNSNPNLEYVKQQGDDDKTMEEIYQEVQNKRQGMRLQAVRQHWTEKNVEYSDDQLSIRGLEYNTNNAQQREDEAWAAYLNNCKPERDSVVIEDTNYGGKKLLSRCPGTQKDLVMSEEQRLIKFQDRSCTGENSCYRQIGPLFEGAYQETWCNCNSSMMYAAIQRTVKTKGARTGAIYDFVNFSKNYITQHYKRNEEAQYMSRADIIDKALKYLEDSHKTPTVKERIRRQLEKIREHGGQLTTNTDTFIKKEVTMSKGWPRLISARQEAIRTLSAVAYKLIEDQVYEDTTFIKKQGEEHIAQELVDLGKRYKVALCLDISSYDSAQTGPIWDIEEHLFRTIAGDQMADLWKAIAHNNNWLRARGFEMLTTTTRNSGEMTTSSSNTLLQKLVQEWIISKMRLGKIDQSLKMVMIAESCPHAYTYKVEGDDIMILADSLTPQQVKEITQYYQSLGFGITIEYYGPVSGASFVKLILVSTRNGYTCYRRIDHSLLKLGWTKKGVLKIDSLTAKGLMKSKIESFKSQYRYSKKVQELADVMLAMLGKTRKPKKYDVEQYGEYIMTNDSHFDDMYGQELDSIKNQIQQHGLYYTMNIHDYPVIFKDTIEAQQLPGKKLDYKFLMPANELEIKTQVVLGQSGRVIQKSIQKEEAPEGGSRSQDIEQEEMQINQRVAQAKSWDELAQINGMVKYPISLERDEKGEIVKLNKSFDIPVYIAYTVGQMENLDHKIFAEKGIVIHLNSEFYKKAKSMSNQATARRVIKPTTTHNDKLMFDWSVKEKKFVMDSNSHHFVGSNYVNFITTAIQFLTDDFPEYASRLTKFLSNFDRQPKGNKGGEVMTAAIPELENLGYNNEADKREVGRYKDEIQRLQERIKELQEQDADMTRVDPDDVKEAFLRLPQVMQQIQKYMEPGPSQKYITALVDPFVEEAVGVRVPSMNPEATFACYSYETLQLTMNAGGSALFAINYDACGVGSWVLLNHASLADMFAANPVTLNMTTDEGTQTVSVSAYRTGLNITQFKAALKRGTVLSQRNFFSDLRLVAAGVRVFSTSISDNISGTLYGYYAQRGAAVNKSLGALVSDITYSRYNAKVHLAAESGRCRGRAGYVIGTTYRPRDQEECVQMFNNTSLFLDEGNPDSYLDEALANITAESGTPLDVSYVGPMRLIRRSAADGLWYPVGRDIDSTYDDTIAAEIAISASSLQRNQTALMLFTGVQTGHQFEIEIARHFEGIVSDDYQTLPRTSAQLPLQYSSPLDIIRQEDYSTMYIPHYQLKLDDDMVLAGLFSSNFWQKAKDLAKAGFNVIKKIDPVKEALTKAAPTLTNMILSKIPGLDIIAPHVTKLVENKVKDLLNDVQAIEEEKLAGYETCGTHKQKNSSLRSNALEEPDSGLCHQCIRLQGALAAYSTFMDNTSDPDMIAYMHQIMAEQLEATGRNPWDYLVRLPHSNNDIEELQNKLDTLDIASTTEIVWTQGDIVYTLRRLSQSLRSYEGTAVDSTGFTRMLRNLYQDTDKYNSNKEQQADTSAGGKIDAVQNSSS